LILCGDIHQKFQKTIKGRWIVNSGPLLRKEASVYNFSHHPGFFIYNLVKEKMDWVEIPHRPAEEVLTRAHIDYDQETLSVLDEFIGTIGDQREMAGSDFVENLWEFVKQNKIDQSVVDILSEVTQWQAQK
jgi:hypothetical protein